MFVFGAIVWLLTKILVEAEITRPLREAAPTRLKLNYLLSCHLCAGVWIGVGVGIFFPTPALGILLSGLAYKAVAHLILSVENLIERLARD